MLAKFCAVKILLAHHSYIGIIQSMAWRLHEHVLRGKIDNRTRGRVKGEIWLAGIDQSLVLDLTGDGAPDLAGCELSFENPKPIPMTTRPPAPWQFGPAGDITAARKVRVFEDRKSTRLNSSHLGI